MEKRRVRPSGQFSRIAMLDDLPPISITVVEMKKQEMQKNNSWIMSTLLICLIIGLGAYIASTYLSNSDFGVTSVASSGENVQPSLSLQGPLSATVKQGQVVTLHGEYFRANDPISLLLDSTLPIRDKNNQIISVRASRAGDFNVSVPIQGSDWSVKPHYIQGVDTLTKQNAYLSVVVSPAGVPVTTSKSLAFSMQNQTAKGLTFHAVVGQGNPDQQRVTLTNISGAPLHWTATANADSNLNWLVIDDNHLAGDLNIYGTDSIGISTLITALKANSIYKGQIVFTINDREQLILPVDLQIADTQSEIVFNPNPVALVNAGHTCPNTTFTLINVGNAFTNWTLVAAPVAQKHIRFTVNGQSVMQGQLASSSVSGDTQVLNVECSGVSAGDFYEFVLYAGPIQSPIVMAIQTQY